MKNIYIRPINCYHYYITRLEAMATRNWGQDEILLHRLTTTADYSTTLLSTDTGGHFYMCFQPHQHGESGGVVAVAVGAADGLRYTPIHLFYTPGSPVAFYHLHSVSALQFEPQSDEIDLYALVAVVAVIVMTS